MTMFAPATIDLGFTAAEIEEQRRMNRMLRWAPRFRAPAPPGRLFLQTMAAAVHAMTPPPRAGVSAHTRRVSWRGETFGVRTLTPRSGGRGIHVDYHGGGWCLGSAALNDPINAHIAADSDLVVASIDYGLLPRTPMHRIIAQAEAAADWALEQLGAELGSRLTSASVTFGGESAGGHLAALALLSVRGRADFSRVVGAALWYGAFDLSGTPSVLATRDDALVLHGPTMRSGMSAILPGLSREERRDPKLSPLYADLKGAPPALFVVGTIDPLIDDTLLMAERWRAAGSPADLVVAPDAPHAFNRFSTRMGAKANAYVRDWLRRRHDAAAASKAAAE